MQLKLNNLIMLLNKSSKDIFLKFWYKNKHKTFSKSIKEKNCYSYRRHIMILVTVSLVLFPFNINGEKINLHETAATFINGKMGPSKSEQGNIISMDGLWRFQLDPDNKGIEEKWYTKQLVDKVVLPGTTDENKKGILKNECRDDRLSRIYYWKGAAWYQHDVDIPEDWENKHIVLYLERTKNARVWFDDKYGGSGESLSAPQIYDLPPVISPGKHRITILVDNSKLPPIGRTHAIDERTQTNWNGIIGKIELRASDPLWLDDIQAYPDLPGNKVKLEVVVGNSTNWGGNANLVVKAYSWNTEKTDTFPTKDYPVVIEGSTTRIRFFYEFGNKMAPLWDEFNPTMIRLEVNLATQPGKTWLRDTKSIDFGMRDFKSGKRGFTINGKGTFLRGNVDCCIFPLTGYPPMDKAEWLKLFKLMRSYGINHYRFHSWCPPEAAFEAADEIGIYLQVELPNKAGFGKSEHDNYLRKEGEQIFKAFGNHPSFVMFTLGNELGGGPAYTKMVSYFRGIDSRHLYAQGTNNNAWDPSFLSLAKGDDFWVTKKTGAQYPVRGAFWETNDSTGHIEHRSPSTMVDYSASIAGIPVPVVGHETGRFEVFPDFKEIPEYTGVLKARNLEIFRERLANTDMLDQADDFVKASGALAVLCYREDIESTLRTPYFGGFQLLSLQDFPGQGTALVGILNAFYESKGLVTPKAWREFCCEVVPLLRMEKYTWTTGERFCGRIEVANYGPVDLNNMNIKWNATEQNGREIAFGNTGLVTLKQGKLSEVHMFSFDLNNVHAPKKLTIKLEIAGTRFLNHYNIWVYPTKVDLTIPKNVNVTESLDETTINKLKKGGIVLLFPKLNKLANSIKGAFQTDIWCFPMIRRAAVRNKVEVPPGTLGILCDPENPALADFPTGFHSDWQWWHLVKNSKPVILDDTPSGYRPIVQVIDNFERNHKLGLIFEAKVGKGKLLVCTIDLMNNLDKPEARQLFHSLLKYAGSKYFIPKKELEANLLKKILQY